MINLLSFKTIEGNTIQYSDDMPIEDLACCIVRTNPMNCAELTNQDPNSNAPIFIEQKVISHAVSEVSISTNQSQQTDAMKNVMCIAALIVFPFIAVGIYVAIGKINPVVAVGIFIGVAVATAIGCFTIVEISEKVSEEKDPGILTTPNTSKYSKNHMEAFSKL